MLHSLFLLMFLLLAAPLAAFIPLAFLAAVLVVVAWNMAERHTLWIVLRSSTGDAAILLTTFLLTVFRDLAEGVVAGCLLAAIVLLRRRRKTQAGSA